MEKNDDLQQLVPIYELNGINRVWEKLLFKGIKKNYPKGSVIDCHNDMFGYLYSGKIRLSAITAQDNPLYEKRLYLHGNQFVSFLSQYVFSRSFGDDRLHHLFLSKRNAQRCRIYKAISGTYHQFGQIVIV